MTGSEERHVSKKSIAFWAILISTSLVIIWILNAAFSSGQSAIAQSIWVFYAPLWIVVISFFGGIHGAPEGALLPSLTITVILENIVLFKLGKSLVKLLRKWRA